MKEIEHYKLRRSVRSYTDRQVEKEKLDQVLEAGLYAPTGMNRQDTLAIAIQDPEIREALAKANGAVMGMEGDPFYGAPTVIVVLADSTQMTWVEDGALMLGNMMNAAYELGLGSCWVHRAKEEMRAEIGQQIRQKLQIPECYEGVGNLILGYAAEEKEAAPRKEGRTFCL